jgi:hypothetical protein
MASGVARAAVKAQVVAELLHSCSSDITMIAATPAKVMKRKMDQAVRFMKNPLPGD